MALFSEYNSRHDLPYHIYTYDIYYMAHLTDLDTPGEKKVVQTIHMWQHKCYDERPKRHPEGAIPVVLKEINITEWMANKSAPKQGENQQDNAAKAQP